MCSGSCWYFVIHVGEPPLALITKYQSRTNSPDLPANLQGERLAPLAQFISRVYLSGLTNTKDSCQSRSQASRSLSDSPKDH
jgi:hypothetical protein